MADEIGVIVEGDRRIALALEQFPEKLHGRLREKVEELTASLAGRIRGAVPRRTGRLAEEIESRVMETRGAIIGRVGMPRGLDKQEYLRAAALEYGVHKTFPVRAHQENLSNAFGRNARLSVLVKEHERKVDMEARRYLRDPLNAMRGEIKAGLRAAISDAIEDSQG